MSVPLDLDQLQSFCAIADCGSFTEAARRVNKTQSAVSMQIKRLEERLGHTLLSRDGRGVALTQHGEALYSRARKMLKINAEIMDQFSDEDLAGAHPLRPARRLCGAAAAGDPVELPEDAPAHHARRALRVVRGTARGHEARQVRPHRLHPGHQQRIWRTVPHRKDVLGRRAGRAGAARWIRCRSPAARPAAGRTMRWKRWTASAGTIASPTPRPTRWPLPAPC